MFAYRGYSNSTGFPTEDGLKIDALTIIDYVFSRKEINKNRIFYHGKSIGANVAVFGCQLNKN